MYHKQNGRRECGDANGAVAADDGDDDPELLPGIDLCPAAVRVHLCEGAVVVGWRAHIVTCRLQIEDEQDRFACNFIFLLFFFSLIFCLGNWD